MDIFDPLQGALFVERAVRREGFGIVREGDEIGGLGTFDPLHNDTGAPLSALIDAAGHALAAGDSLSEVIDPNTFLAFHAEMLVAFVATVKAVPNKRELPPPLWILKKRPGSIHAHRASSMI